LSILLHDPDFFVREIVEIVNQAIDLAVGGVDLALQVRPGRSMLLVEGKHLFDRGNHTVVPLPLRRVGEVDGAERKMRQVASAIRFTSVPNAQNFDSFFLHVELVDNPIGSNPNVPIAF